MRGSLHSSVAWLLGAFAGEVPLELRLSEARLRFERGRGASQSKAALEGAILAALVGERADAESFLLRSRPLAPPELEALIELASALVLIEAGYPTRAEGALERAEAA